MKNSHIIKLVPSDEIWSELFQLESQKIQVILKNQLAAIHHIGSTAIPNMPAKPIIDILIELENLDAIPTIQAELGVLEYSKFTRQIIPYRSYFSFREEDNKRFHLHIYERGDPQVARHVNFRDYLIAHPGDAQNYAETKRRLVQEVNNDMYKYVMGKEKCVQAIDAKAKQWAVTQNIQYLSQNTGAPARSWTLEKIMHSMIANLNVHMTHFAQYIDAVEFIRNPEFIVVNSGLKDDTFNYVLDVNVSNQSIDDKIKQVASYFAKNAAPFSWWLSPSDLPLNLFEHLEDAGFKNTENNKAMYLDLDTWVSEEMIPSELKIIRAQDEKTLHDFALVLAGDESAFKNYFSWISKVLTHDDPIEYYVGYVNDKPVVRGLAVYYAGVVGLHWLSTAPDERKKGYGNAMQQFRLKRAKELGYHLAVLQASAEGYPLYRNLGYKECGVFKEFKKRI